MLHFGMYINNNSIHNKSINKMENTVKNTGKEKSDMLTMLENLERMFDAVRYCVNLKARSTLQMSLAIEAETLSTKLKLMLRRWKVYLPFDENVDVDYISWGVKILNWSRIFNNNKQDLSKWYPYFEPSDDFWLDLYKIADCPTPFDEEKSLIIQLLETHECRKYDPLNPCQYFRSLSFLLDKIEEDEHHVVETSSCCVDKLKALFVMGSMLPDIESDVQEIPTKEQVDALFQFGTLGRREYDVCCEVSLVRLSMLLGDMESFLNSSHSNELLERSCKLVLLRCPSDAYARMQVNKWKNSWPQSAITKKAQQKKEQLQDQLRGTRWGKELEEYLNLDAPLLTNNADFGRFLFKNRKEIDEQELKDINNPSQGRKSGRSVRSTS